MAARHMTLTPNQHPIVRPRVGEDVEVQQEVDIPHGAERADVVVAWLGTAGQAALGHTVVRNQGARTGAVHPLVSLIDMNFPADVAVAEQP